MNRPSHALHRLKVATARLISRPEVGRALNFLFQDQFPSRGIIAFTRSPAVSDVTRAQLFWGIFESSERRMVKRYLGGDLDTVELGAGMGVISSYLARALAPGRRLVCVEANPGLVPLIEQNVAINASTADLAVIHGAVDYSGASEVEIAIGEDDHLSSRVGNGGGTAVRVPALPLREVLRRAGVDGPYALVTDIEGTEHDLFAEEDEVLARCQMVIAELHTRRRATQTDTIETLVARIETLGFRLVDRHGGVCVFDRQERS